MSIFPEELSTGVVGLPYVQSLGADGTAPRRWVVNSGNLPPGLSLNRNTGQISGTPTRAGEYVFTIVVVDSGLAQRTAQLSFSIDILERLSIDTSTLEPARVGETYLSEPIIEGGVPPYRVRVVGLPAGLTFNTSTGRISGSPISATSGTRIEFMVDDSGRPRQTVTAAATFVVKPRAVEFITGSVESGTINERYEQRLMATRGDPPYRWAIVAGVLPAGLELGLTTGVIAGTPTTVGQFTFTVEVSDSDNPVSSARRQFTILIRPQPVSILTMTLIDGMVGSEYLDGVVAVNGTSPYRWSVEGDLPPGLTLNAETGELTGTPTMAGEFTFLLRVEDGAATPTTASRQYSIEIAEL